MQPEDVTNISPERYEHSKFRDEQLKQGRPRSHLSFLVRHNWHETGCWKDNFSSPGTIDDDLFMVSLHPYEEGAIRIGGTSQQSCCGAPTHDVKISFAWSENQKNMRGDSLSELNNNEK